MASKTTSYAATPVSEIGVLTITDTMSSILLNLKDPSRMQKYVGEIVSNAKEVIDNKGGIERYCYKLAEKSYSEKKLPIAANLLWQLERNGEPINKESQAIAYLSNELKSLGNIDVVKEFEREKKTGVEHCLTTLKNPLLAKEFGNENFEAVYDFVDKRGPIPGQIFTYTKKQAKKCEGLKKDMMPTEIFYWVNGKFFLRNAKNKRFNQFGRYIDENLNTSNSNNSDVSISSEPAGKEGDFSFGCKRSGISIASKPSLLSNGSVKAYALPLEFNIDVELLHKYYMEIGA